MPAKRNGALRNGNKWKIKNSWRRNLITPANSHFTSLMEEIQADTRFGLPINWVDTRIGVEERRVAAVGTMPSDLATDAAINALADAGINPEHISMIIYCGIEKDFMEPGTAHIVQKT